MGISGYFDDSTKKVTKSDYVVLLLTKLRQEYLESIKTNNEVTKRALNRFTVLRIYEIGKHDVGTQNYFEQCKISFIDIREIRNKIAHCGKGQDDEIIEQVIKVFLSPDFTNFLLCRLTNIFSDDIDEIISSTEAVAGLGM